MKFLLMHQTVVTHDAIGHDLMEMRRVLLAGHECALFCEYHAGFDPQAVVDLNTARQMLQDPALTVIYHHSIHWPLAEELLCTARARIIFKYHNITPPSYFFSIPDYRDKCLAGREQTYRFARHFSDQLWLSDSLYNLTEIGIHRIVRHQIVPPFLHISDNIDILPDESLLRRLIASERPQALFVGRFVPNKGHFFLVQVLCHYRQRYGDDLTLFVAGKRDGGCAAYYDSVMSTVAAEGLQGMFQYIGETPPAHLLSYFLGCDAYLCCSEHEGFCVPVVEAQSMCLPVVARATAAVPETLGDGQITHGEDPAAYADSLHQLREDAGFRESVIETGYRNYQERFTRRVIEQKFVGALEKYLGEAL